MAGRERTVLPCSSSQQSSIAPVRDGGSEVELGLLLQCRSEQNGFLKLMVILIVSTSLLQL